MHAPDFERAVQRLVFLYIINAVNYPSAEENSNFAAAMEREIYESINLVKQIENTPEGLYFLRRKLHFSGERVTCPTLARLPGSPFAIKAYPA